MSIIEKFNQDKETTIQFDISELLHFNFSDYLTRQIESCDTHHAQRLLSIFPLHHGVKYSEIKSRLKDLENVISTDLYDDIKDEIREIWNDYKWVNSKVGKEVLEIEEWIKKARCYASETFPNEYIYIGRTFINPVSIKIGGYVNDTSIMNKIQNCFNEMKPPVAIQYSIKLYDE